MASYPYAWLVTAEELYGTYLSATHSRVLVDDGLDRAVVVTVTEDRENAVVVLLNGERYDVGDDLPVLLDIVDQVADCAMPGERVSLGRSYN